MSDLRKRDAEYWGLTHAEHAAWLIRISSYYLRLSDRHLKRAIRLQKVLIPTAAVATLWALASLIWRSLA